MVMRILPPDEAKKRARANLTAWKRRKALAAPEKAQSEQRKPGSSSYEQKLQEQKNARLGYAAILGLADEVKSLISSGADVNSSSCEFYLDYRVEDGFTPLMGASFYGYTEVVELLIASGADVNAQDCDGSTALMHACVHGYDNADVIRILLRNGADPHIKDGDGMKAIDVAISNESEASIKVFKEFGLEVEG